MLGGAQVKHICQFLFDISARLGPLHQGAKHRLKSCAALGSLAALAIVGAVYAQETPVYIPRINTVADLRSKNLGPAEFDRIYLVSYGNGATATPGDGAAGLFVKNGHSCTDDGGSVIKDNDTGVDGKNCFYRQNVNGDLRQWGLTNGSAYDVYATSDTTTVADASARLNGTPSTSAGVFAALVSLGIKTFHTGGVSLLIGTRLDIPRGAALTCDTPPVNSAPRAEYRGLPGSLVIRHDPEHETYINAAKVNVGTVDEAQNSDVEIYNCAVILPEWYVNPAAVSSLDGGIPFDLPDPRYDYQALEAIRANMIVAGDFAITASAGAKIHDISIMGFDNCLYLQGASQSLIANINMDCSIGLFANQGGGNTAVKDVRVVPFLTRQAGTDNVAYWDITGISASLVEDHEGECELDLHSVEDPDTHEPLYSVADLPDIGQMSSVNGRGDPYYYPAWVARLKDAGLSCLSAGTGRSGNDAAWAFYVKAKDAGEAQTATVILVGSKYATSPDADRVHTEGNWLANTGVIRMTGPVSNLAVGMRADSPDTSFPGNAVIVGIVQRCTGPDPDDGYNGCVIVAPAPPAASTGTPVVTFWNPEDEFEPSSDECNGGTLGYCFFLNAAQRPVAGGSPAGLASARLPASRGGQFGAGFLADDVAGIRAVNTFSYGHYYGYAVIDSNSCAFFQEGGDTNAELDAGNDVFLYVAGSSRGCVFLGNKNGQSGGSIVLDTFGIAPEDTDDALRITSSQLIPLDTYLLGEITVEDSTANWPTVGTMHLCRRVSSTVRCDLQSEYVSYIKVSGSDTHVRIIARSRLGSKPGAWTENAIALRTTVNNGSTKHADRSTATIFADLSNPVVAASLNQFEIHHGAASLTSINTSGSGVAFVSTNTSGVTIVTSEQPKTAIYFEDENASALTIVSADSAFANYIRPGTVNLPLSYHQWFGTPQAASDIHDLGDDETGKITVVNTADWPETGILRVDSEYMAYHIHDGTQLYIEQRGLCGSSPDTHSNNAIVTYMQVVFGCPATGQGQPQFTIDAAGSVGFGQSILAHGQVYMDLHVDLDSSNIRLCPRNGKGLIIDGVLRAIPGPPDVDGNGCAIVPTSNLSDATGRYYVYASYRQVDVTGIVANPDSKIRLYVSDNADFYPLSPITCYGITKVPAANVVEDSHTNPGLDGDDAFIDLTDKTFVSPGDEEPRTGACSYVALEFSNTAHTTAANGVEIRDGGQTGTLVGMIYADSSHIVHDSSTQRHVASWFNRRIKTCIVQLLSNKAVSHGSSYQEVDDTRRCHFVSWEGDDLHWSAAGTAWTPSGTLGRVSTSVGFDGTTAEPEFTTVTGTAVDQRLSIVVSGSKSGLDEAGSHYITMLYDTSNSVSATYKQDSSVEVRIPQ